MDLNDLCAFLGFSRSKVKRLIKDGSIPGKKFGPKKSGSQWRFRRDEILALWAARSGAHRCSALCLSGISGQLAAKDWLEWNAATGVIPEHYYPAHRYDEILLRGAIHLPLEWKWS
jgi:excisionase family DNA binding protein